MRYQRVEAFHLYHNNKRWREELGEPSGDIGLELHRLQQAADEWVEEFSDTEHTLEKSNDGRLFRFLVQESADFPAQELILKIEDVPN